MHIVHVLRRLVLPRSVRRVVGVWAPDVGNLYRAIWRYVGMEMLQLRGT